MASHYLELLRQGKTLRWAGRFAEALHVLELSAQAAEEEGEPASLALAEALSWQGVVLVLLSKDRESLERARHLQERALAIELSQVGQQSPRVAETLRLLGLALEQLGAREDSLVALSQTAQIARDLGKRNRSSLETLATISSIALELGSFDEAACAADEYLRMSVTPPLSQWEEIVGRANAGDAFLKLGDQETAIVHYQRAVEIAHALGRQRLIDEMQGKLDGARHGKR